MYNEKFKTNIKTYEKDLKEAGIVVKFEREKARLNSLVYGSLEAFQTKDISKKEKLIFEPGVGTSKILEFHWNSKSLGNQRFQEKVGIPLEFQYQ